MLTINEIKDLAPKTKAEIYPSLPDDPEVLEYFLNQSSQEWLENELKRRDAAFIKGIIQPTTRETLNKSLVVKWDEKQTN